MPIDQYIDRCVCVFVYAYFAYAFVPYAAGARLPWRPTRSPHAMPRTSVYGGALQAHTVTDVGASRARAPGDASTLATHRDIVVAKANFPDTGEAVVAVCVRADLAPTPTPDPAAMQWCGTLGGRACRILHPKK